MNKTAIAVINEHASIKPCSWFNPKHNYGFIYDLPKDPLKVKSTGSRVKVASAANANFWYFLCEILRIKTPRGLIKVKVNSRSFHFAYAVQANMNVRLHVKDPGEQDVLIAAYCAWLHIKGSFTAVQTIAANGVSRDRIKRYFNSFVELLPEWLTPVKQFHQNWINVGNKCKHTANNIGRGITAPILMFTDVSKTDNIDIILPNILAASTCARHVAREKGEPHFSVFFDSQQFTDSSHILRNYFSVPASFMFKFFQRPPVDWGKESFGAQVMFGLSQPGIKHG